MHNLLNTQDVAKNALAQHTGLYLYGVIKTSTAQEFGEIGIGDEASKILTIGFKDVAAIVSASPFMVYDSLAKEKTVRDLVTHQFVIEKVMENFTIIPVKFGTMVRTEDEVINFLEKGYTLLSNELCKMEGKIELDVVVSWKLPKVLAALYHSNRLLQNKQKEIALQGQASIEDKVALGKLVEQALQTQKASYQQLILQTLTRGTIDVCLHEPAHDEMIFNAAFLVEKQQEDLFTEIVTGLDQELEDMVNFRVVGPLPLYSFSTVLLERIDPASLEDAKRIFGLHGEITEKTVRAAYRQLAQKYHPDTSNDDALLDFPLLHSAYKLLKKFAKNGLMHVEVYHWEKDFQ